jgi:pyridoxal phosphate enzyme (YggS family)
MMSLCERYREILAKIDRARSGRPVTLVAVSKFQSADAIEELYRLGHRDFGENYVQELLAKQAEFARRGCAEIRWHFIGHLQTNKVKSLASGLFCLQSLDSEKLAREFQSRLPAGSSLMTILEVNIDREEAKSGFFPEDVKEKVGKLKELAPSLKVVGLMCIPKAGTPEESRGAFQRLRALADTCSWESSAILSMGMSADYEIAIQEGATHVRVGTSLFGARPAPSQR